MNTGQTEGGCEQKHTPVQEALIKLERSISNLRDEKGALGERVDGLFKKINPVLSPEAPALASEDQKTCATGCGPISCSEIVSSIAGLSYQIDNETKGLRDQRELVNEVIDRVEL